MHLAPGAPSARILAFAAICALRDGAAPPTINLDDLDDRIAAAGVGIAAESRNLRQAAA